MKVPHHSGPISQLNMVFWGNTLECSHACPVNLPGFFFHLIIVFVIEEAAQKGKRPVLEHLHQPIITLCVISHEAHDLGFRLFPERQGQRQHGAVIANKPSGEYWREQWAALCNAKFEEKGHGERIDHRSYERQGIDLLPTVHVGPAVRQMEAKGIRTNKGEFNRWIKATNSLIQNIRKKIAALLEWLKESKEELSKPQTPDLISLLQSYFDQRNAGAYTQKARANNLKELSEIIPFLQENGITDVESLEGFIFERRSIVDKKKMLLDAQTAEMKELQKLPDAWDTYKRLKSVADGLRNIKFTKAKEKYKAEHKAELNQFYAANRLLTTYFSDGKYNSKAIQSRYAELEQQHNADYAAFKDLREETQLLWRIKSHIDAALKTKEKENTHTHEQSI